MIDDTASDRQEVRPVFPRRAFVAAGLSALVAGGGVLLAGVGAITAPRTETFRFSRGTTFASGEGERLRGHLAGALADDRVHMTILGHSGDRGDAAANRALSEARAEAAATVAREMGLPAARITASGVGGSDPVPRRDGESDRAYQARLARVEVSLQVRR